MRRHPEVVTDPSVPRTKDRQPEAPACHILQNRLDIAPIHIVSCLEAQNRTESLSRKPSPPHRHESEISTDEFSNK